MKKPNTRRERSGTRAGTLPQEVHTIPSALSIVALVVGAVILTAAINVFAVRLLEAFSPNRGYSQIEMAWTRLESQEGPPDWLVLGDSGCRSAVVPEVFQEVLEGPVTELCTIGNMGLMDDAWLLQAHIDRYGPPHAVLIVHVYDVWQRALPPLGLLAHIPRPLGYWKRFEPSLDLDWHESLDVFMARYIPLVADRRSLNSAVNDGISELFGKRGRDAPNRRMTDTTSIKRDFRQHVAYAASTRFAIAPGNLEALNRIVGLADEHGFEVYLANSPVWEGLAADPGFQEYNSDLEASLTAYANGNSSVHYLAGTSTYPMHSLTRTVDHIKPGSAIDYSRDLAERLVRLPSFTVIRADDASTR